MNDKVVDLGRHDPTIESITTRLHDNMGEIKHITAIVEWDDGSSGVYYDTKKVAHLCFDKEILSREIQLHVCNVRLWDR